MISVRWALDHLSVDALRYYLCAIAPESKDADFDWDEFMNRYNGELCDVVGNFIHRSMTMTCKHFDGAVPQAGLFEAEDVAMLDAISEQINAVAESLETFRFRQALEKFIDLGRRANVYFDAMKPWTTRKTDLERTGTTLYICCQVVKGLCYGMMPFLPEGAAKLAAMLNLNVPGGGPNGGPDAWQEACVRLEPGWKLGVPEVLFPKIDADRVAELAALHLKGEAF